MVDTFVDWEDIDSVLVDIGRDIQARSLAGTVLVGRTDLEVVIQDIEHLCADMDVVQPDLQKDYSH